MVSRKKVLIIGLLIVSITVWICGSILYVTWCDSKETIEKTQNQKQSTIEFNKEDNIEQKESEESRIPEPAIKKKTIEDLIILQQPECYTYQQMETDLLSLPDIYGTLIQVDSLGETVDGRQVYHIAIGNDTAPKKIFINAGIHAREYLTSHLVMNQLVAFLKHVRSEDRYQGYTYQQLLENVQIHVVPMVNPDGITISQLGLDGIQKDEIKQKIREIAKQDGATAEGYYLTRWKANANGVDLNRNFDALWNQYQGAGHPSSDKYKGTAVGCEVESAAMIALTQQEQFVRTISYHTQGSVIYWYFAQEGELYETTLRFGERISRLTGYPMDANYEYLDPAGYKDWAICERNIPSLTIEIGKETSPVPFEQYTDIWKRNQYVWEETLLDII